MTHKHEDLKLTAVRYYLDNDTTYAETCRIFNCSERSLKRWIDRFQDEDEIKRHNREPISYKVDKEHVDYAIRILRSNEQITMVDLDKILRDQFEDFDITPQHLGQILRDNNKTRKRTRKEHFPETRYGRPIDKQSELNKFYKKVDEYRLDKIICLDETSIQLGMYPTFSSKEDPQKNEEITNASDNSFELQKLKIQAETDKIIHKRDNLMTMMKEGLLTFEQFKICFEVC